MIVAVDPKENFEHGKTYVHVSQLCFPNKILPQITIGSGEYGDKSSVNCNIKLNFDNVEEMEKFINFLQERANFAREIYKRHEKEDVWGGPIFTNDGEK